MPLTPLDIHNKSFNKGFRGYDEDEVNEFLEQIMKDYELILREKRELEEQLKKPVKMQKEMRRKKRN